LFVSSWCVGVSVRTQDTIGGQGLLSDFASNFGEMLLNFLGGLPLLGVGIPLQSWVLDGV